MFGIHSDRRRRYLCWCQLRARCFSTFGRRIYCCGSIDPGADTLRRRWGWELVRWRADGVFALAHNFRTWQGAHRVASRTGSLARPEWCPDRERFLTLGSQVSPDAHAGRGTFASPPDRWGRPQTEVSGRPDCGCGSRTSRGAFLVGRSGTSPGPRGVRDDVICSRPRPPSACEAAVRCAPAASRRRSRSASTRTDAAVLRQVPVAPEAPVRWRKPPAGA